MKVSISTDGDFVSSHFGRCPTFTIVEIDDKGLVNKKAMDNPGHHPGLLPQFFHEQGIDYIIAGGMGTRASGLFKQYGIETLTGISGRIDEVIDKLIKGTLEGGESLCIPGSGKNYGLDKTECDHASDHKE